MSKGTQDLPLKLAEEMETRDDLANQSRGGDSSLREELSQGILLCLRSLDGLEK